MTTSHTADYDVIAVGAGFAGISLSYHLREAGLNTKFSIAQTTSVARGPGTAIPVPRRTVSPIITA